MSNIRSFVANDERTGTMLVELSRAFGIVQPERALIATAYFSPDGFREIQSGMEGATDVRILLGERPFLMRRGPTELLSKPEDEDLAGPLEVIDWFEFLEGQVPWILMTHVQRKQLLETSGEGVYDQLKNFDLGAWHKVQQLVRFLSRSRVAVRRYLGDRVGTVEEGKVLSLAVSPSEHLHAKAYILRGPAASYGAIGSSNLTKGGLQNNVEANLITEDPAVVSDLEAWFGRKWDKGQDCKSEFIHMLEECVLFGRRFYPWQVFLKALHAAYGHFLGLGLGEDVAGRLALFQQEGVARAVDLLDRHWGAMVCDSVGLGKTYTGLGILREFVARRENRAKALVICPAQLESNWSLERLHGFGIFGETVSMESLVQLVDIDEVEGDVEQNRLRRRLRHLQGFDVVLVDESHNFRNPGTKRYRALMEIIRGGEKPDKRVLLLTATPINNSLWDLYHQLMLITRGDNSWYAGRGPVGNLEGTFRNLEKQGGGPGLLDTMLLTLVRRTRHDIRQRQDANEPMEINGKPLVFPDHEIPEAVTYSLESLYEGDVYKQVIQAIEKLTFAVYNLEAYGVVRPSDQKADSDRAIERNGAFIGIIRTVYLKRMESSVAALTASLRNQIEYLELFLKFLGQGKVLFPKDRDKLRVMLGGSLSDEAFEAAGADDEGIRDVVQSLVKLDVDPSKLTQAVIADRDTLAGLLESLSQLKAGQPAQDPKVAALRQILEGLPQKDALGLPTKVVVFTNYRDTANHLFKAFTGLENGLPSSEVRAEGNLSRAPWVSILTGSDDKKRRQTVLTHFAPLAALRDERDLDDDELVREIQPFREHSIDLLIATDVLSEGQNLQDAQYLVNYDLHWNPVRMIQRAGRIDRLFSPHKRVYFYNVMPERGLEDLLSLVKRLQQRVKAIDATLGLDASVLGEVIETKALNDLMMIRQGGSSADKVYLEGERKAEFDDALDQLRGYMDLVKSLGTEEVRTLPDGIYSIREGDIPGVFVQLKMPKEYGGEVFWRFYPTSDSGVIASAVEAAQKIACDRECERADLPEDENPFTHLIQPLTRAIEELGQEYRQRVSAQDPGELVRLVRKKLQDPDVQEAVGDLTNTFFEWCGKPHPSDMLKREDSVQLAYRKLKAATVSAEVADALKGLWVELSAKGLDRPLPRPDDRQPTERDLQLVCWELVIPPAKHEVRI